MTYSGKQKLQVGPSAWHLCGCLSRRALRLDNSSGRHVEKGLQGHRLEERDGTGGWHSVSLGDDGLLLLSNIKGWVQREILVHTQVPLRWNRLGHREGQEMYEERNE